MSIPKGALLDKIFSKEQGTLIKRAIVQTTEINDKLVASVLRIGTQTDVLIYGQDANGNTHYTMMSKESFNKLKKIKLK